MTSPGRFALALSVFLLLPSSGAFGAGQVLTMTGAIPDKVYEPWKTVSDGKVLQSAYSGDALYKGTYSWNSPPKSIGPEGFSITLSVRCETGAKQNMATGIGISGDFDFVVSAAKRTKAETQAPANCDLGQSVDKSITVHVLPLARYREGETAKLRIGAFWGLGVTYSYTAGPPPPPVVKPEPPAPPVVKPKSPAPPATGGGQYLGCFKDQGAPAGTEGRDLDGTIRSDGGMTTALCLNECRAKNFAYAGTQYSSYCFCGGSYGKSGAANNCDMKCAGNPGETCGGAWANSVYGTGVAAAVPSPPTPSLGCYKDTPKFDLDGFLERNPQNTPQRCIAICKAKGFAYAGVQYGESCLCGNSYGRYGAANNCNFPCTGDSGQICGGHSANNVYPTGVAVAAAQPPKQPSSPSGGSTAGAAGKFNCEWGIGQMPGCVALHYQFKNSDTRFDMDLLNIAADPTSKATPEAQRAATAQLNSGVLDVLLQDDTVVHCAQLILNGDLGGPLCDANDLTRGAGISGDRMVINAVDDDPRNKLWNCATNRVGFGKGGIDLSRCFSFTYKVPPGGIKSAHLHVAMKVLEGDTEGVIMALGRPSDSPPPVTKPKPPIAKPEPPLPPVEPPPPIAKPEPPLPPVAKPKPPPPPPVEPPIPPVAKPEPPIPPVAKPEPPIPPVAKPEPPPPKPEEPKPPAPPAVAPVPQTAGDCDGDGRVIALDARCALEISVQLAPMKPAADMDDSKDVTSRDAVVILQRVLGN